MVNNMEDVISLLPVLIEEEEKSAIIQLPFIAGYLLFLSRGFQETFFVFNILQFHCDVSRYLFILIEFAQSLENFLDLKGLGVKTLLQNIFLLT